uniref:Extracellular membrane protein CFEM domain-containing protein n=1 Tax=Fusarium oxysporum (strain Fo5176) TaxID=660025 RepID=A0A0D2YFM9_FUSOF
MGFPAQLYLAWCRRFQRCAATCTEAVIEGVGSKTTDLGCRCSDLGSVAAKMTPCIALKGNCDFDDVPTSAKLSGLHQAGSTLKPLSGAFGDDIEVLDRNSADCYGRQNNLDDVMYLSDACFRLEFFYAKVEDSIYVVLLL